MTNVDVIADQARISDLAKVRRARAMAPAEKFLAGAELFEEASEWSLAGIAARHPGMTWEERVAELRRLMRLSDEDADECVADNGAPSSVPRA